MEQFQARNARTVLYVLGRIVITTRSIRASRESEHLEVLLTHTHSLSLSATTKKSQPRTSHTNPVYTHHHPIGNMHTVVDFFTRPRLGGSLRAYIRSICHACSTYTRPITHQQATPLSLHSPKRAAPPMPAHLAHPCPITVRIITSTSSFFVFLFLRRFRCGLVNQHLAHLHACM